MPYVYICRCFIFTKALGIGIWHESVFFFSCISQSETISLNGALQKRFNSDNPQKEREIILVKPEAQISCPKILRDVICCFCCSSIVLRQGKRWVWLKSFGQLRLKITFLEQLESHII